MFFGTKTYVHRKNALGVHGYVFVQSAALTRKITKNRPARYILYMIVFLFYRTFPAAMQAFPWQRKEIVLAYCGHLW
jgi:hypothetical protein